MFANTVAFECIDPRAGLSTSTRRPEERIELISIRQGKTVKKHRLDLLHADGRYVHKESATVINVRWVMLLATESDSFAQVIQEY